MRTPSTLPLLGVTWAWAHCQLPAWLLTFTSFWAERITDTFKLDRAQVCEEQGEEGINRRSPTAGQGLQNKNGCRIRCPPWRRRREGAPGQGQELGRCQAGRNFQASPGMVTAAGQTGGHTQRCPLMKCIGKNLPTKKRSSLNKSREETMSCLRDRPSGLVWRV